MKHVPLLELPDFARTLQATLERTPRKVGATVVHLRGDLGAGKTTFVQAIAKAYGVEATVASPTYVLMRSYDIPQEARAPGRYKKLVHIDAYRLERPQEWHQLNPEEFLREPGTLVFIEWPERIAGEGPEPDAVLDFSNDAGDKNTRAIEVRTAGL